LNFEITTPVRAWVFNLILGGVIAVLVAGLLHMDIKDTGSFFVVGFLVILSVSVD